MTNLPDTSATGCGARSVGRDARGSGAMLIQSLVESGYQGPDRPDRSKQVSAASAAAGPVLACDGLKGLTMAAAQTRTLTRTQSQTPTEPQTWTKTLDFLLNASNPIGCNACPCMPVHACTCLCCSTSLSQIACVSGRPSSAGPLPEPGAAVHGLPGQHQLVCEARQGKHQPKRPAGVVRG